MTIQIKLSAETPARLAVQAAARSLDVSACAAALLVATRNVRDFEGLGITIFDPRDEPNPNG